MITEKEINATLLSPTKKDYYQIWMELLELSEKISERWSPESTNESDPGIVLLKVLTGIADKLNYTVDKNILEAYMPSAAQEESMRKLCDMLGYSMKYYRSATTDATIYYSKKASTWESSAKTEDGITTTLILPKFSQLKNTDGDIIYSTLEDAIFTKSGTVTSIPCIEGTINKCAEDNDGIVTIDNIDDDNKYYLPVSQVAENGVFIYNVSSSVLGAEWTQVDNLNTQTLEAKVYKFGYDSKEMLPYVQFPSDISSLIQDGLCIYYTTTSGASGNISAKTLSTFDTPSAWSVSDEATDTEYNTTGISHTADEFVCYNGSAATNGTDKETLNNAYNNFKKTVGTFETLVTCRDYMNKIYQLTMGQTDTTPVVSNCIVSDIKDDINSAITICSFNGYGISYDARALTTNTSHTVTATPIDATISNITDLPEASVTYYNKVYKITDGSTTIYKKCVATTNTEGTITGYIWGNIPNNDQKFTYVTTEDLLNSFDLVLYPFKTIYSLNTKTEHDSSFKYDNSTSTFENIKEKLDDYKTISHNFKTVSDLATAVGDRQIACIKNYLKLNAKITTTVKVSSTEWSLILKNIKTALYENFNCRKLDFSEEIPFDSILEVIEQADTKIKNVSLDDPDLYTAIMLDDNTEYFLQSEDEAAENIKAKLTAAEKIAYNELDTDEKKGYINDKIIKAKELYNKLALRNILAGRVPMFNYDQEFGTSVTESKNSNYELIYKHTTTTNAEGKEVDVTPAIKYLTTELTIKSTESNLTSSGEDDAAVTVISENQDDVAATNFNATLGENEIVQFRAPNFKSTITYPAYTNYYLKLSDSVASHAIPATFETLKTFANEDKSRYSGDTTSDPLTAGRFTQIMNMAAGKVGAIPEDLIYISDEDTFLTYKKYYGGAFTRTGYRWVDTSTETVAINPTTDKVKYNNIFYSIIKEYRYNLNDEGKFVQSDTGSYLQILNIDGNNNIQYIEIKTALYRQAEGLAITCYDYEFITDWPDREEETEVVSWAQPTVKATGVKATTSNGEFVARDTKSKAPTSVDRFKKCYTRIADGGWNNCIPGRPTAPTLTALANCVGYAEGRFNEISYQVKDTSPADVEGHQYIWNGYPVTMYENATARGFKTGQVPAVGALAFWKKTSVAGNTQGHVAVVEKVNKDEAGNITSIITSQSGYASLDQYPVAPDYNDYSAAFYVKEGTADNEWGIYNTSIYSFLGFVYHPDMGEDPTSTLKLKCNVGNGTWTTGTAKTGNVLTVITGGSCTINVTPSDGYGLYESCITINHGTASFTVDRNLVTLYNLHSEGSQTEEGNDIEVTITCRKNPDLYLYPVTKNTYATWYDFVTSCKDYSTRLSGIYKNTGLDMTRAIGKYVDVNRNKYVLATTWPSPADPMTYFYVQDASEQTVVTTVNESTNATVWGHTLDGLGRDAVYNELTTNAEYELQENEYLCINYTSSEAEGTDENGSIETTTTVVNNYYGPGTIIKVNFAAQSSDKKKLAGTSYAKTSGFDFKAYLGTELGEYGIPGMYSLGVNDTIEIRVPVNVYVYDELNTDSDGTNPVYVYFKLNNEQVKDGYIKFLDANGGAKDEYMLQEGEYFWYTDRNKQTLNYCGDGCKIINHTAYTIQKPESSSNVAVEDIFEDGIDIIPWITLTGLNIKNIDNPGETDTDQYIEWHEYQYINLTTDATLDTITFTEANIDRITPEWQECTAATWTTYSGETNELPAIVGTSLGNWEVRTKLTLVTNPDQSQTLTTTAVKGNKQDGVSAYASDPTAISATASTSTMVKIEASARYKKDEYGNYTQDNTGDYWLYSGTYYDIVNEYADNRYSLNEESNQYEKDREGDYWNTSLIAKFMGVSLKSNYIVSSASDVIQTYAIDEEGTEIDDFTIKAFNKNTIKNINNQVIMLNTVNSIYSKIYIEQANTAETYNKYTQLYCALPDDDTNYGLLMMYYEIDNTKSTSISDYVSIKLKDIDGNYFSPVIFNYPDSASETWWSGYNRGDNSYYLKPGINVIKITKSCTIEIYAGKKTSDTIVFDQFKIVNQIKDGTTPANDNLGINLDLLQYYNTTPTNNTIEQTNAARAKQLLADINAIDLDHKFYYSLLLDDDVALNINTLANETLQTPAVLFEYNNVNNKFTISEIDTDYLDSGISIARSSLK